jgi:hypothetical protein
MTVAEEREDVDDDMLEGKRKYRRGEENAFN